MKMPSPKMSEGQKGRKKCTLLHRLLRCISKMVLNRGIVGKSIALSTKLVDVVDGRACWRHLCTTIDESVSCMAYNPLTPLLRFVVQPVHVILTDRASCMKHCIGPRYLRGVGTSVESAQHRATARLAIYTLIANILVLVTFLTVLLNCWLSGWIGSRVVSVLDSGAEGPGFKS